MKKIMIGLVSAVAIAAFAGSASADWTKGKGDAAGGQPSCTASSGKSKAPGCD